MLVAIGRAWDAMDPAAGCGREAARGFVAETAAQHICIHRGWRPPRPWG